MRGRRGRPLVLATIVFFILAGVSGWFVHLLGKAPKQVANPQINAPTSPAGAAAAGIADQKSIAVLPFVNMSSDKENDYLCDGFAEDVINALTQLKGLRVPARTSSFVFKGARSPIDAVVIPEIL